MKVPSELIFLLVIVLDFRAFCSISIVGSQPTDTHVVFTGKGLSDELLLILSRFPFYNSLLMFQLCLYFI